MKQDGEYNWQEGDEEQEAWNHYYSDFKEVEGDVAQNTTRTKSTEK